MNGTLDEDALDHVFMALADPTRRAMLNRLAKGAINPGELAEPFAISQQAVSKHIKVLERAGLVSRSRVSRSRPCQLEPQPLLEAASWVEQNRQLWKDRHDRLENHLRTMASKS